MNSQVASALLLLLFPLIFARTAVDSSHVVLDSLADVGGRNPLWTWNFGYAENGTNLCRWIEDLVQSNCSDSIRKAQGIWAAFAPMVIGTGAAGTLRYSSRTRNFDDLARYLLIKYILVGRAKMDLVLDPESSESKSVFTFTADGNGEFNSTTAFRTIILPLEPTFEFVLKAELPSRTDLVLIDRIEITKGTTFTMAKSTTSKPSAVEKEDEIRHRTTEPTWVAEIQIKQREMYTMLSFTCFILVALIVFACLVIVGCCGNH